MKTTQIGFHTNFLLSIRFGTYSFIHLFQYCTTIICAAIHLLFVTFALASNTSCGMCGWGLNSIKRLAVNGRRSRGSTLKWVHGRAFKMAASSAKTMRRTSSLTVWSLSTVVRALFHNWIKRSHTPPKCGGPWGGGGISTAFGFQQDVRRV